MENTMTMVKSCEQKMLERRSELFEQARGDEEESCVVVGRCADVILAYQDDVVNVFIYANMEDKIRRIKRMYHLGDRQKAAKLIRKTEKIRRNYYQYYTDEVWGDKRNKALMINTSQTGVDGAVELIIAYLRLKGYLEEGIPAGQAGGEPNTVG